MKEIKLWVKAKDVVTGFEWIVTSVTKYLTWCDRVVLTPESKKGEIKDGMSCDITSCIYLWEWVTKHFEVKEPVFNDHWLPRVKTGWPEIYKSKKWY